MMKLHYSAASPFVRMVMVTAHELGIAAQIDTISTGPFLPTDAHEAVSRDNPLGKIPALITNNGIAIHDSRVICDYLCHQAGNHTMMGAGPEQKYKILTRQSLAVGLSETAVALRYELGVRPEDKHWPQWIDRQYKRIDACLAALNEDSAALSKLDQASIATACSLGYLDFRYPDLDWRQKYPDLKAFYEVFAQRPSMLATRPDTA